MYFDEYEIFDIISSKVKVSTDKKQITKLGGHKMHNWGCWSNNCYGIIKVISSTNNIYEWNLRICMNGILDGGIKIGISNMQQSNRIHNGEGDINYVLQDGTVWSEECSYFHQAK